MAYPTSIVQRGASHIVGGNPTWKGINQSTSSESWSQSGNVRFKRGQLGGRDGYPAPKYPIRRAMLLSGQKPTRGFIAMVRFHALRRCRKDPFMSYN